MAVSGFGDSNGYVADGMVHIDPETLAQSLAEFGPGAGRGDDHELSASVQIVIERASNVFNVSGVGLMLIGSEDQELRYVASTGATARAFELAQIEVGAGPCIDSFVLGDLVRDEDMRSEPRWSELCDRLGDEPVRAVLGVPARVNGETVGTLNAFCDRPRARGNALERACGARLRPARRATAARARESRLDRARRRARDGPGPCRCRQRVQRAPRPGA